MAKKKEIPKRPVGRPKKDKVAELLTPTTIPMKPASNNFKKVRGSYHNWFMGKCMVRCLTMCDKVQFSGNDVH
jgi:hypothetical protein